MARCVAPRVEMTWTPRGRHMRRSSDELAQIDHAAWTVETRRGAAT